MLFICYDVMIQRDRIPVIVCGGSTTARELESTLLLYRMCEGLDSGGSGSVEVVIGMVFVDIDCGMRGCVLGVRRRRGLAFPHG